MTITLASWHLPLAITLGGLLVVAFVAWLERREGGDFSIHLLSFAAFMAWVAASIVAWLVWFLSRT